MLTGMMQVNRSEKYEQMHEMLNEKQWRHSLAMEAQERGSVAQVAQEAKVSQNTIRRGLREVEAGDRYTSGDRQREEGGGRKKAVEKDATLQGDLESLLDPKGDPMSLLKWTCKSVAHLKQTLQQMGHQVADTTIRRLLRAQGYSLRANKKNIEEVSST
jgi:transposase